MGKEYTMPRRALSNICTGLGTIGIHVLFANFWITALMLLVFAYVFAVLFARYKYTRRYKILLVILTILLVGMFTLFCKPKTEPTNNNCPGEQVVIEEENTDDDNQDQGQLEDQQVTVGTNSSSKKNWSYSNLPDKMEGTYSNVGGNSKNDSGASKGQTKVEGSTTHKVVGESKTSNDEIQAAKDAEKNGDKLTDLNEGVIAGTKPETPETTQPEKPKDESTKINPKEEKVEEVPSAESGNKQEKIPEEIPLEDQLQEVPDDVLDDLFATTPKEENGSQGNNSSVTTQPEEKEETPKVDNNTTLQEDKTTQNEEQNKAQDTTPKVEEKVEEQVPDNKDTNVTEQLPKTEEKEETKTTPVTIVAIDGNQAYAGDSVQFKVTGDVKSVQGLDGLKYSLSNGCLTVYTNPGEATVISPKVIGADGVSSAAASVTINVINVAS